MHTLHDFHARHETPISLFLYVTLGTWHLAPRRGH